MSFAVEMIRDVRSRHAKIDARIIKSSDGAFPLPRKGSIDLDRNENGVADDFRGSRVNFARETILNISTNKIGIKKATTGFPVTDMT